MIFFLQRGDQWNVTNHYREWSFEIAYSFYLFEKRKQNRSQSLPGHRNYIGFSFILT